MDDILLDDPRKASAKRVLEAQKQEKLRPKRTFGQYIFDLILNTLACAALLAINFTLFVNAGNYNLFASSALINQEAVLIYTAILALSFVLTFLLSFSKNLQNALPCIVTALFVIAIINQFATFEKHSALLILLGNFLSENANNFFYEYSFAIIGTTVFLIAFLLITFLKRSYRLYIVLALFAALAWIISEAYFNTSQTYFKTTASSSALRAQNSGKTLLFFSFNNLTSPNNLRNLAGEGGKNVEMNKTFNNMLGVLAQNGFVLYPNALMPVEEQPFYNLVKLYNPNENKDPAEFIQNVALQDNYFDFTSLQYDKMRMKASSLYDMLRKKNYNINVYQTRELDTCYTDNKLAVTSCKNKINYPFALNGNNFSLSDKTLLLVAQWLNSTGFVDSLNVPLKFLSYILPVEPLKVRANEVYAVNAFRVFDQIADDMDRKKGNQAYFAVIDLPSDNFVYDEFCHFKKMEDWVGEKGETFADTSLSNKQKAYANQLNCLTGALEYFLRRLDKSGQIGATTIVLTGLDNPQGLLPKEIEYYPKMQSERQILLAIKPEENYKFSADYTVCRADEILASQLLSQRKCQEFADLETTDKNLEKIKEEINKQKFGATVITAAKANFNEWFKSWVANNQNGNNFDYQAINALNDKNAKAPQPKLNIAVEEVATEEMPVTKQEDILLEPKEESTTEEITTKQTDNFVAEIQELDDETAGNTKDESEETVENIENSVTGTDVAPQDNVPQDETADLVEEKSELVAEVAETTATMTETIPSEENAGNPDDTAEQIEEDTENIKASDVIPETLFDENQQTETPREDTTTSEVKNNETVKPEATVESKAAEKINTAPTKEEIINKAKQAFENKQKMQAVKKEEIRKKARYLSDNIEELSKNEEFRQVLEAPVAQGSDLSPQELKKQYYKNLIEAADKAKNDMNIEVKVIENK